MLPGLRRMQWAPASIAFSASVWLKWMSAITGIGDSLTIVFSASTSSSRGTATADDVGAGVGDLADLLHRRRQVGGLGLGHRLHGDRRAAADRHAADEYLALGSHGSSVPGRPFRGPRGRIRDLNLSTGSRVSWADGCTTPGEALHARSVRKLTDPADARWRRLLLALPVAMVGLFLLSAASVAEGPTIEAAGSEAGPLLEPVQRRSRRRGVGDLQELQRLDATMAWPGPAARKPRNAPAFRSTNSNTAGAGAAASRRPAPIPSSAPSTPRMTGKITVTSSGTNPESATPAGIARIAVRRPGAAGPQRRQEPAWPLCQGVG